MKKDAHVVVDFVRGRPFDARELLVESLRANKAGNTPAIAVIQCGGESLVACVDLQSDEKRVFIEPVGQVARRLAGVITNSVRAAWDRLGVDAALQVTNLSSAANTASVKSAGAMFSAPVAHSVTVDQAIKACMKAFGKDMAQTAELVQEQESAQRFQVR